MSFQTTKSRSGNYTAHVSGSLIIFEFHRQASAADINEMTTLRKSVATRTGRISTISVAPGAVERLDEDARAAIKAQQEATAAFTLATSVVITGGSLSAMVVRTIVSGVHALSRSKIPSKTFSSVAESLAWLQSLPDQLPDVKLIKPAALPAIGTPTAKAA
ncbi:MAG: hypothetical protein ACOZQL_04835 [Myxococcota bacterium]